MWKTKGKKQMILKQDYITKEILTISNFNGGQGLDHWSPSSSQNFTRFVLNYSLPQEIEKNILD
jgi:hypothetical protein